LLKENKGATDPHIWLDPLLAKQQAWVIRDALIHKDPQHRTDYGKNYDQLAKRFDVLDREYREMVKRVEQKEFVVSHAAFAYLAKRYGLKQIAVARLSPLDEPGPQEMKQLVETVKQLKVKDVLFETLVNGKTARVVQQEAGAEALVLNPLEGLTRKELNRGESLPLK
jgi:zinc transport system substrate-binding protein